MKIGTKEAYVEIEELERYPGSTPCSGDVKVNVTLAFQNFSGSYDEVWLELAEMERFIMELEILDEKRNGNAKISSMSPEEFALEIRSSDSQGHMEIEAHLHRYQYNGSKRWPIFLKGGFETQPETIRQLISYFKALT